MSTNLYEASDQWAKRPDDERFWTLQEMYDRTRHYADHAVDANIRFCDLQFAAGDGEALHVAGQEGQPALMTNWAFKQLASRVRAPSSYLTTLPAQIAADCLNYDMSRYGGRENRANVLFHSNGNLICRSMMTDSYARIWNHEVIKNLLRLPEGWRVPPARATNQRTERGRYATEADVLTRNSSGGGLSINVGDWIEPAGLYASDHDMFVFMVNENVRIKDGSSDGLARGFFCWNSEVGASAFYVKKFLYNHVCGNHIVWDAKDVDELKIIHVGRNAHLYSGKMGWELESYARSSPHKEEGLIAAAKNVTLADNQDDVIDAVFAKKSLNLTRKSIEEAYELAVEYVDTDAPGTSPRSAWGFAQGLTRLSQRTPFGDERNAMDRAAGKLLTIKF